MNNMKIAFVILHYQNIDVTIDCVEHLKKLQEIEKHNIIIVDNASPNESGNVLSDMYKNDINIICLQSDKNGGFAYGNNMGYEYARNNIHADIIIAMNSDVNIEDNVFIINLLNYAKTHSEICIVSPDIVTKNGFHQNPYLQKAISTQVQKKIILKKQIGRYLYSIPLLGEILTNRKSVTEFQPYHREKVLFSVKDIVPHGACVIYLPKWVYAETRAFIKGTFLFVEEELLFDYCNFKNYDIIYEPQFVVFHMEDASQDSVNATMIQKKRMQMKYEIESRKLLLKYRKNGFGEEK